MGPAFWLAIAGAPVRKWSLKRCLPPCTDPPRKPAPSTPYPKAPSSAKKSFPLSSTTINAGKFTTSTRQTASMPSSG